MTGRSDPTAPGTERGIDVDRVRAQTPALLERTFLNHAGASPTPDPVLDVVVAHLRDEARLGGYEAEALRRPDLERTRSSIATLLGCTAADVAFATSATDAWERVFWAFQWEPGDVVLTCRSEYVTNVLNLLVARDRFGIRVDVVDDDPTGAIDVADLRRRLEDDAVRLVSVSHVPTHGGLVNPVVDVGAACRGAGVPFLLDACQSAGQIALDVDEIGCDALTATGRKYLRAPRGTGFLYVRPQLADRLRPAGSGGAEWTAPLSYDLPPGAARFESYERSIAGVLGLGVAVERALALGLDAIEHRVAALADRLRTGLTSIDGVTVRDLGARRCGIVTFTVDGIEPIAVRDALSAQRVQIWTTGAPFARLDLGHRGIEAMARASVHYVNTDDEIDRTIGLVERIASGDVGRHGSMTS